MHNTALVPVFTGTIQHQSTQLCNARDLHAILQVGRDFSSWIKDRIEQYGFVEGEDYSPVSGNRSDGRPGKQRTDYHLTLDTAKELAMVENNERGRQVRRYFIQIEKEARAHSTPLLPMPGCVVAAEARLLRRQIHRAVGQKKRQWALDEMCRYFRVNSIEQIPAQRMDEALAFIDGLRQDPQLVRPVNALEWAARMRLQNTRFLLTFNRHNQPELRAMDLDEFVTSPSTFADMLQEDSLGFLPPDLADLMAAAARRLSTR